MGRKQTDTTNGKPPFLPAALACQMPTLLFKQNRGHPCTPRLPISPERLARVPAHPHHSTAMNARQQLRSLLQEVYRPDETPLHQLRILSGITGERLTLVRVDLATFTVTATAIAPILPAQLDPAHESTPST